jgi:hypothetical protein
LANANPLTNELVFRWDPVAQCLLVIHPDTRAWPTPLARVSSETLAGMLWPDASRFIGEFVTLLMPALRERYEAQLPEGRRDV